jgi:magnesium chelatase family protein
MRPGEISMAANGVLFLDELAEFPAMVLDTLRQPLEEGLIRVSRARGTVTYPARFLLVAAMNPCPCGYGGAPGSCHCSDSQLRRYVSRVSGPLLDRFDLRIPVAPADVDELLRGPPGEATAPVAERVAAVRLLAAGRGVRNNASIPPKRFDELAPLDAGAARVLEWRLRHGALSARGVHRVRRVARTIADLDGQTGVIGEAHLCAALDLRADRGALGLAS